MLVLVVVGVKVLLRLRRMGGGVKIDLVVVLTIPKVTKVTLQKSKTISIMDEACERDAEVTGSLALGVPLRSTHRRQNRDNSSHSVVDQQSQEWMDPEVTFVCHDRRNDADAAGGSAQQVKRRVLRSCIPSHPFFLLDGIHACAYASPVAK